MYNQWPEAQLLVRGIQAAIRRGGEQGPRGGFLNRLRHEWLGFGSSCAPVGARPFSAGLLRPNLSLCLLRMDAPSLVQGTRPRPAPGDLLT